MNLPSTSLDEKVRFFLAQVIETSEKIQTLLASHSEERDETVVLYQHRRDLFEHADEELAAWIHERGLTPAEPWQVYKTFMLALEKEQDRRKYEIANAGATASAEVRLKDNPFLVQRDEISDKAAVDEAIINRRMTANDLLDLMVNITAVDMAHMIEMAKEISSGSIWDHDYDL